MSWYPRRASAGLAFAVLLIAGCGESNLTGLICGAGTHADENHVCVPDTVVPTDGGPPQDALPPQPDAKTDAAPAKGQIGDPCSDSQECESLSCANTFVDERLTQGMCTVIGCDVAHPCPYGAACIHAAGTTACMRYCDPGTPCPGNLVCQPDPTGLWGVCAPKCRNSQNNDCPAGGVCTAEGYCTTPATCDPGSPSCASGTTCMATSESPTGGYCFPDCTAASGCKPTEVCQPLGAGSSAGICVPPPCATNADCPTGATCQAQHDGLKFCQPPADCATVACADSNTACVGGYCLPKCAAGSAGDDACKAIQSTLLCADTFGVCMPACSQTGACDSGSSCFTSDWVCLPTGSFPGSPCPDPSTPTTGGCLPIGDIAQVCLAGSCLPTCSGNTGDAVCGAISSSLTCVEALGACLPKCGSDGACDTGLSCFASENACLPTGSFPGSPCRTTGPACDGLSVGGTTLPQVCMGGSCVPTCSQEAHCTALDPSLTCEQSMTGGLCVYACVSGVCPTGYSCYDAGAVADGHENACLPTGGFPQSPCRPANDPNGQCDHNLTAHGQEFDLECFPAAGNICLPACGSDWLCQEISGGTSNCMESLGAHTGGCMQACATNSDCGYPGSGFACFSGVCLPAGSFPGSPCPNDAACSAVGGVPQTCIGEVTTGTPADGTCLLQCTPGAAGDAVCGAVQTGLKCFGMSESPAGGVCMPECLDNACGHVGAGYSCLTSAQVCLPTGSFPGSPCAAGDTCAAVGGVPQACNAGTCVPTCSEAASGDAVCGDVDPSLTCMPMAPDGAGLCVFKCDAIAACPSGYSCFEPAGSKPGAQNACLPTGAFPGSACPNPTGAHGGCGTYGAQMECFAGACLVPCDDTPPGSPGPSAGDTACAGVSGSLTCMDMGLGTGHGGFCLLGCVDGTCDGDFSCYDPGAVAGGHQNACLPTGAFPGSPCHAADGNHAAPYCADYAGLPQSCFAGTCLVDCDQANAQTGDSLCATVDASLTCMPMNGTAGSCVKHCNAGACDIGYSCYGAENACLPNGSFPGSTCPRYPTAADPNGGCGSVGPVQMDCAAGTCMVPCTSAPQVCGTIGAACDADYSGYCMPSCATASCPADMFCHTETSGEKACLPDGMIPGGPCATGDTCARVESSPAGAFDMACFAGQCVPVCWDQRLCGNLGAYACMTANDPPVCLPDGSFPGGPCAAGGVCAALPGGLDQTCVPDGGAGLCAVECVVGNATNGDALCQRVSPALACVSYPGLTSLYTGICH
jgi:hypothetical protein